MSPPLVEKDIVASPELHGSGAVRWFAGKYGRELPVVKKALPQSSILNLEDYQLWPAPGHLLSLQGLPLLSKEPFIHPSGRRLRHGFHDTKCSPTREPPLHTAYAAGLSTRLSNIHSKAGIHTFRKNQVFGIPCSNKHGAAIRRAGFHTLQPVLFES